MIWIQRVWVAAGIWVGSTWAFAESDMVFVPAGEFLMGSDTGYYDEAPEHRVTLSAYWIDKYEVSVSSFAAFVREAEAYESLEGAWFRHSAEGCLDLLSFFESKPTGALGERHKRKVLSARFALAEMLELPPSDIEKMDTESLARLPALVDLIRLQAMLPATGMTWRDARRYAASKDKRLPTEAEWERAARGLEGAVYPWGNEWKEVDFRGVWPVDDARLQTSEVGCSGMAGNVWEWVEDWYGENYYEGEDVCNDPRGPLGLPEGQLPRAYSSDALLRTGEQGREDDTRKVIRGGGFGGTKAQARFNFRCSRRLWCNPNYWHADVGFRCVKDI